MKFQKKEHIEQCPKCLDMTIISEDIDAEFCYPVNREKTVFKVTCNSGGGIGCGLLAFTLMFGATLIFVL